MSKLEKEVSYALEIGVTLAVLSVLLTIVFLTVSIGNEVKIEAYDNGTRIVGVLEEGNISSLIGTENEMPTAAAYSLLRANGKVVHELICYDKKHTGSKLVTDLTTSSPCLINHMTGRVSLEVEYVNDSWYRVTVHNENCPWYYGDCTCD